MSIAALLNWLDGIPWGLRVQCFNPETISMKTELWSCIHSPAFKLRCLQQRPQPVQIICICPDICAFPVIHHRHLSDICAICQKCQFEEKRADKYCCFSQRLRTCIVNKQTLPWNFDASMRQIISSQNKLMWWLRAFVATWAMSHSRAYCRKSRFVTNTRFFGFVLSRLLLRHLGFDSDFAQISAQKIGGWGLWSDLRYQVVTYSCQLLVLSILLINLEQQRWSSEKTEIGDE